MHRYFLFGLLCLVPSLANADEPTTLFDGKSLDAWEYSPGGWVIDPESNAMMCKMETVRAKNGTERVKGMGYIWSKETYGDFVLTLSYKLSPSANSGVFFRTDKDNPVQGGFEVQLTDDVGFQKVKGKKDPKNLNGAFYDCQAASGNPANPVGQWNDLKLTVHGSKLTIEINGQIVNEADIDRWDTPQKNPDGSSNKFKTALKDLPRRGRIGFQNHGQVVWFKDVVIQPL
ncbi:MAG: DUF1080 domain-containing protein [Pirellulaceae bacterium]|nr:DUF1080 domain-containing protein [Pirellulaceae bacterium]